MVAAASSGKLTIMKNKGEIEALVLFSSCPIMTDLCSGAGKDQGKGKGKGKA